MGKSIFRFTTLVFQGLVTAGVIGVFVLTVVFANGTGTDMSFVWGKCFFFAFMRSQHLPLRC